MTGGTRMTGFMGSRRGDSIREVRSVSPGVSRIWVSCGTMVLSHCVIRGPSRLEPLATETSHPVINLTLDILLIPG